MRADGGPPWCGFTDDGFEWRAITWLDALVLRVGGPDLNDRWAAHHVPFDDPAVRRAGAMFDELVAADLGRNPDTRPGGSGNALEPMFGDPPGCWMYFAPDLSAENLYGTNSNSSGQAELPGDDLIVSLQCFGSTSNVANTIMHELGHNLGLHHGGNVDANYKPNYNSVMNYRFQFPGRRHQLHGPG